MEEFYSDVEHDGTGKTVEQSSATPVISQKSVSTACRPVHREKRPFVLPRKRCMNPLMAVSLLLLVLTLCAVLVGALVGYTYCYYEHQKLKSSDPFANQTASGEPGLRARNATAADRHKINAAIAYVFGTKLRQLFANMVWWNR